MAGKIEVVSDLGRPNSLKILESYLVSSRRGGDVPLFHQGYGPVGSQLTVTNRSPQGQTINIRSFEREWCFKNFDYFWI